MKGCVVKIGLYYVLADSNNCEINKTASYLNIFVISKRNSSLL